MLCPRSSQIGPFTMYVIFCHRTQYLRPLFREEYNFFSPRKLNFLPYFRIRLYVLMEPYRHRFQGYQVFIRYKLRAGCELFSANVIERHRRDVSHARAPPGWGRMKIQ